MSMYMLAMHVLKKCFKVDEISFFSSVPKRVLGANQFSYLADKHGKKLQIEVVHRD